MGSSIRHAIDGGLVFDLFSSVALLFAFLWISYGPATKYPMLYVLIPLLIVADMPFDQSAFKQYVNGGSESGVERLLKSGCELLIDNVGKEANGAAICAKKDLINLGGPLAELRMAIGAWPIFGLIGKLGGFGSLYLIDPVLSMLGVNAPTQAGWR